MVKNIKRKVPDAYGEMLRFQLETNESVAEIVEREDRYMDTGSVAGLHLLEPKKWPREELSALKHAKGRVLDVGGGAGRHSLYLQDRGLDVTAIDSSPGAIGVQGSRRTSRDRATLAEVSRFKDASFDTIIMMGNNFGLLGSLNNGKTILKEFHRITSSEAIIIAATRDPYKTNRRVHLDYHRFNKRRGRMSGQIRMRIRFAKSIGPWFDYLLVSPKEMKMVIDKTGWQIREILSRDESGYFTIIEKSPA
jgi:ubiquinone/menaquinone biosynthesis C-methylase UbiE